MAAIGREADASPEGPAFQTTLWSMVLAAGNRSRPESRSALESLCRAYWYPLYAFARRSGRAAHDAEDLVQGFFERAMEKDYLKTADPSRGRFRAFLLTMFQRFLARERERDRAFKRGGGSKTLSLDVSTAESRFNAEPAHDVTPERIYERRWALTVIDQVFEVLRKRYKEAGSLSQLEALQGYLLEGESAETYRDAARRLDMTEVAVKVAVLRLRRRFGEVLRAEVSKTVEDPGEVTEELQHLASVLGPQAPFSLSPGARATPR